MRRVDGCEERRALFGLFPFLLKLYAGSGYQGPKFKSGLRPIECGDRHALRHRQVRGATQAVDRRAYNRLAQPVSPTGQRPGMSQPQRARIPTLGVRPDDGTKALSERHMISDRLLDQAPGIGRGAPKRRDSLKSLSFLSSRWGPPQ